MDSYWRKLSVLSGVKSTVKKLCKVFVAMKCVMNCMPFFGRDMFWKCVNLCSARKISVTLPFMLGPIYSVTRSFACIRLLKHHNQDYSSEQGLKYIPLRLIPITSRICWKHMLCAHSTMYSACRTPRAWHAYNSLCFLD